MAFIMDVDEVKNYEEMLYPTGKYLAEIVGAKEGVTASGVNKFDIRFKILDTIPADEPIDTDNFLDPIGAQVFYMLLDPEGYDKASTKNMMQKKLKDILNFFEVEPSTEGALKAEDFKGCTGGIVIAHEKFDKNDPDSELRAVVKRTCAV